MKYWSITQKRKHTEDALLALLDHFHAGTQKPCNTKHLSRIFGKRVKHLFQETLINYLHRLEAEGKLKLEYNKNDRLLIYSNKFHAKTINKNLLAHHITTY